ncbi:MAG: T9SS type A sorting domain-containing protein, partial [Croceimicrobium sp.]
SKFSLIGDPALRLAIPEYSVSLSNIQANSGKVASQDTIKALSLVELNGQVQDANGQAMTDFNGILNISIYDKESQRQTLSNDGIGTPLNFKERNSLLYRGKVDITNGQWSAEFRAPLGINYQFGFGKVSMYAYDNESNRDAAGAYDSVIVGGFNENAPEDEAGPAIRLFMNDASFVRGGITGSEPFIYAELQDSSGINTVGNGIGQDLRAVLNRASDQPIILNEFYEADLNSYKSGSVRYQLFDLEPGAYQLDLRAFDIYNNPSEATTEFVVAESADLALDRVLNYPNPFTTYTEFQFEHNRANQPLQVQVQIFTVSGRLVKTINREIQSIGNRVTGISWNGLDDFGDKIGKGVYVYRIKVKSLTDNSTADEYEKLVILR